MISTVTKNFSDSTLGHACVATSDLDIDFIEKCEDMEDYPECDSYCGDVDNFQIEDQGCVKNGES